MGIKFIRPKHTPASVYVYANQLQSGFQQKTVDATLLKYIGQLLWDYANLPLDITAISQLIVQEHHNLPWECLYHPDGYFIAELIPITRQITTIEPYPVQHANKPVKILHFATQAATYNANYLNFSEEQAFIYQALWAQIQSKHILLHSTQCGDFSQFCALLNQHWDIVILSGHSIVHNNQKSVVFNSQTEDYKLVSYDEIVRCFQTIKPKCVVLGICETGDLTARLHQVGIPYVVGMQSTILDRASSLFIQHFLQAIAQGSQFNDAAQTARVAMQTLLKPNEKWSENEIGQWLIPCVYSHNVQEEPLFAPANITNQTPVIPPLIGRQAEFCELETKLLKHKTVWLYGVGGIGKTALALALQQHFIARHQPITYIEVADINQPIPIDDTPILAVSRLLPPNPIWLGFRLLSPQEHEFIRYAQQQGFIYPQLQLRLIYKMLQGNYQGLHLLNSLPHTTQANKLRQQLCTVQRYLKAYQSNTK